MLYRTYLSGRNIAYAPEFRFQEAAEAAHLRRKLPLVVAALAGNGWTFMTKQGEGTIFLSATRVDVCMGATRFSTTPDRLWSVSVKNGQLCLRFHGQPELFTRFSEMRDAKLLLAALRALGARVE